MQKDPGLLRKRYEEGYYKDYFKKNPSVKGTLDNWYYQNVVLKEESEFLEAKEKVKSQERRYGELFGKKPDVSYLDRYSAGLVSTREAQYQERQKLYSETQEEEKTFYEKQLEGYQTEFKNVLASKPIPVGKTPTVYTEQLNLWIESNKDVLGRHYDKSMQVIGGDIKLSGEQMTSADYILNELTGFQTYKGGSSAYSERILSTSPKYAYITPKGAPQAIAVPYFEGEYEEFDPTSFTITKKESKVERWGRLNNPIISEKVLGTRKLPVNNPFVREFVINTQLKSGVFGFKGNFSQDAAKAQKLQIDQSIQRNAFNQILTTKYSKLNSKDAFFIVSPPKKIISGSNKMPRNPFKNL